MIYLLYGEDTYRSRKKLNEIIAEYRAKTGSGFNLHRFDAEEDSVSLLKNAIQTSSLFDTKKLVVVERIFSFANTDWKIFKEILRDAKNSKDLVVVLWHAALDEASKKLLEDMGPLVDKTQEFKLFRGESLNRWIAEEAKKRGLRLFPAHLAFLSTLGSDLWAISNELDKMAVSEIPGAGLQGPGSAVTVFQLGDTFFSFPKRAIGVLLNLLRQGEDDFKIFSYLAGHSRIMLIAKDYLDKKQEVSAKHGIHPFVIKKASAIAGALPLENLRKNLLSFFEEDFLVKVGISKPADSLIRMLAGKRES